MALFYVLRPSSLDEPNPVFTRYGNLSKSETGSRSRAQRVQGRLYATNGHESTLVADFYVEPALAPVLQGRAYWAARNQVALFASA